MKILLVDDHKIIRDGLRTLLEKKMYYKIVGEAENGLAAIEMVRKLLPDIVLMDIAMPGLNGIEATRRIIAESPNTKVIVLSMHSDKRFVEEMFKAGASGYLLKECAFEELLSAISAVALNQNYLSSAITSIVVKDYVSNLKESVSAFTLLTPREREVIQLIAEGKSTSLISSMLNISVKTVETHRKNIMNKLKINTVAEITKYAIREGITSLNS